MQYTKLGKSDLHVSRVCLGCMGFGDAAHGQHSWTLNEEASRAIIRRALEWGVNFFDTAIVYQNGTSEQYLGRALRDFARREDVVVATKFPVRSQAEIDAGVSGQEHIRRMLDRSLQNLGMDHVDLYICHMWDYRTPLYEIMEGLGNAVKAGKARYIGISNCFAWQLCKANELARREGFAPFVSVQGHYNLIFREEEREMIPYCREEGIAVTPYSALTGGRLSRLPGESSKRLEQDEYARGKYDATAAQDERVIERVAELARFHDVTMTEIALAWLMGKGTIPVAGATKLSHVEGAARAAELALTAEENAYLEACYTPHALVGVMAQNTRETANRPQVWSKTLSTLIQKSPGNPLKIRDFRGFRPLTKSSQRSFFIRKTGYLLRLRQPDVRRAGRKARRQRALTPERQNRGTGARLWRLRGRAQGHGRYRNGSSGGGTQAVGGRLAHSQSHDRQAVVGS